MNGKGRKRVSQAAEWCRRNLLDEGRTAYRRAFFAQARPEATQTDEFFSGEPTGGITLFSPILRI